MRRPSHSQDSIFFDLDLPLTIALGLLCLGDAELHHAQVVVDLGLADLAAQRVDDNGAERMHQEILVFPSTRASAASASGSGGDIGFAFARVRWPERTPRRLSRSIAPSRCSQPSSAQTHFFPAPR